MSTKGTIRLKPVGPYNFDLSSSFYRRSKFEMVDRYADRYFIRPVVVDGQPVIIKIPYGNGLPDKTLTVKWESPTEFDNTRKLRSLLARMFYIDFDIDKFYKMPLDKVMRGLVKKFMGFRPILTPDVFESAAWSIIGQQVNLQFAYQLKSRLVEYVGKTFSIDGEKYYLFPDPAEVANVSHETLRSMKFSGRKAEYLHDFAQMIVDGKLDAEGLADLDYETASQMLLSIRGIGPWSANYILMRGAGHRDAFPVGDSGINHAVSKHYGLDKKPKMDDLLELGEQWRPYRSLATFYLWKSL